MHDYISKEHKAHGVPVCPCCKQHFTPTHFMIHCPHASVRNVRIDFLGSLSQDAAHAFLLNQLTPILAPSKWDRNDNQVINKWCTTMTEMFIRALAATENPSLSAILMNSKCQSPLLNENVEGEIFRVRYRSGPHKGTWRIRATDYNPFERTFTLISDHLDIREGHWLHIPDQRLNDMFLSGNVKPH